MSDQTEDLSTFLSSEDDGVDDEGEVADDVVNDIDDGGACITYNVEHKISEYEETVQE